MEYVEYITRRAVWKMDERNFALSLGKVSVGILSSLLNTAIQERCTWWGKGGSQLEEE